jgi:hypothetical protein
MSEKGTDSSTPLFHRIRLPKPKIEIKPGPRVPLWAMLTPKSELPHHFQNYIKDINEKDEIWMAVGYEFKLGETECRYCENNLSEASFGLCGECFESFSQFLISKGLLLHIADRTIESFPKKILFLSRFGKPKIWINLTLNYGIVPSMEIEFCATLNLILKNKIPKQITKDILLSWHNQIDIPLV